MTSPNGSPLSRSVSAFANCLAGLCVFLLAPLAAEYIRPEMLQYLARSLPREWADWCAWGFIGLLGACVYFGLSSAFQVTVQSLFHRNVRKNMIKSGF